MGIYGKHPVQLTFHVINSSNLFRDPTVINSDYHCDITNICKQYKTLFALPKQTEIGCNIS